MNNLIDKFKTGVKETGKQAKTSFEISRLKSQINAIEKQIEAYYQKIGEAVFFAFVANDFSQAEGTVNTNSKQIMELRESINNINQQIRKMSNTKDCVCGKVVPFESQFCSSCGYRFEIQATEKSCVCGNLESLDTRFCSNCGHRFEE